jgi:hypothetical protein
VVGWPGLAPELDDQQEASRWPVLMPILCRCATGGTSLRFEDDQFVYNWKTPTTTGCYELFVTLADGGVHSANFSLG